VREQDSNPAPIDQAVAYGYTLGNLSGIGYPSGRQLGMSWVDGEVTGITLGGAPLITQRWKLKREKELLRGRTAWDAKWLPGRHAGMSGEFQSLNSINKLEEKMKKQGCCP
jgi:hypothetical protein